MTPQKKHSKVHEYAKYLFKILAFVFLGILMRVFVECVKSSYNKPILNTNDYFNKDNQ